VVSDKVPSQLVKLQISLGHAFYSFGVYALWETGILALVDINNGKCWALHNT